MFRVEAVGLKNCDFCGYVKCWGVRVKAIYAASASWNPNRKCLVNVIDFRSIHHLDQIWPVPHLQITSFIAYLSLGSCWAPLLVS